RCVAHGHVGIIFSPEGAFHHVYHGGFPTTIATNLTDAAACRAWEVGYHLRCVRCAPPAWPRDGLSVAVAALGLSMRTTSRYLRYPEVEVPAVDRHVVCM